MNTKFPFGEEIRALGGFRQGFTPFISHGLCMSVIENCPRISPMWRHFKVLKLHFDVRPTTGAHEFAAYLKRIRERPEPTYAVYI